MNEIAGIGSRNAPKLALKQATFIGQFLSSLGYVIRSGNAEGMDKAFQKGASYSKVKPKIFHPSTTDIPDEAFEIAKKYHDAWHRCKPYAKKLLARNVLILLGKDLQCPVSTVFYWNPLNAKYGGTNHSLRIANGYNIPCYRVEEFLSVSNLFVTDKFKGIE